jgi:hypothetical protein
VSILHSMSPWDMVDTVHLYSRVQCGQGDRPYCTVAQESTQYSCVYSRCENKTASFPVPPMEVFVPKLTFSEYGCTVCSSGEQCKVSTGHVYSMQM